MAFNYSVNMIDYVGLLYVAGKNFDMLTESSWL